MGLVLDKGVCESESERAPKSSKPDQSQLTTQSNRAQAQTKSVTALSDHFPVAVFLCGLDSAPTHARPPEQTSHPVPLQPSPCGVQKGITQSPPSAALPLSPPSRTSVSPTRTHNTLTPPQSAYIYTPTAKYKSTLLEGT
ncbi:hypothetical protein MJO29_002239 [Puccinia striiformis f. sp. tritici]|nr:hypothetical protein MJO29_002239 [Puccinia striiformis f. sp. tritici]